MARQGDEMSRRGGASGRYREVDGGAAECVPDEHHCPLHLGRGSSWETGTERKSGEGRSDRMATLARRNWTGLLFSR
jgi:hypothetical protein